MRSVWSALERDIEINKKHVLLFGRQIAAARTLAGLTLTELAEAARISVPTLKRMEGLHTADIATAENDRAVRIALQMAGVEFVNENGGNCGVRLKASQEADGAKSKGPASDAVDKMDAAIEAHRLILQ